MPIIAVDFETEYGELVSAKRLGNVNYSRAAKAFLVALHCPDLGLDYVGPLENAPWDCVRTVRNCVAHNAGFDLQVFRASQDRGQIPKDIDPVWHCSADLSAFSRLGRALKDAVLAAYGVTLPKEIRTRAKNKKWPENFTPEKRKLFQEYCLQDARYSWRLWNDYQAQWPAEERAFAEIIRFRSARGVQIDSAKIKEALAGLEGYKQEALAKIPWAGDGKRILSMWEVKKFCAAKNIYPPESLAEDSEECKVWEDTYGEQYPLIAALRQYRKANMYLKKVQGLLDRCLPENGRFIFDLKYFGAAATGRLSGTGGWNIQNLPREPYKNIDIRALIVPAPGHKFVIADYAQIEPRVTAWVCGSKILAELANGQNIYEADARLAGLWSGESGTLKKSDPDLYKLCKATTLGLAYGMGFTRFRDTANSQLGLDLDPVRCQDISMAWHFRYPEVRRKWQVLEKEFRASLAAKENYSIQLPSGRRLEYYDLERLGQRYKASPVRGSFKRFYWGGSLFENVIQAIARDVLRDAVLRLEAAGVPVLFTAHDEVVCECPFDYDSREIEMLMLVNSSWSKGLPLAVEVVEAQNYLK